MAGRGRAGRSERPRARTESVVVPFPRTDSGDRLELGLLVPSSRSLLIAFAVLGGILLASSPRARRRSSASARSRSPAPDARVERQVRRALDGRSGRQPLRPRPRRRRRSTSRACRRSRRSRSTAPTRTPCASRSCPSVRRDRPAGRRLVRRLRARSRDRDGRAHGAARARAHLGRRRTCASTRASSSKAS